MNGDRTNSFEGRVKAAKAVTAQVGVGQAKRKGDAQETAAAIRRRNQYARDYVKWKAAARGAKSWPAVVAFLGVAVLAVILLGCFFLLSSVGAFAGGVAQKKAAMANAGFSIGGWSPEALKDIPPSYVPIYESAAARCPGYPPQLLAATGKVESDHGRGAGPGITSGANGSGAAGPMQMGIGGAATDNWSTWGLDGEPHDEPGSPDHRSVYDPKDAIPAAMDKLCSLWKSAGKGDPDKIWMAAYLYFWGSGTPKEDDDYVQRTVQWFSVYSAPASPVGVDGAVVGVVPPNQRVAVAIQFAFDQLGETYVWGANGPDAWDCSSLLQASYRRAGIEITRTTRTQFSWALQHNLMVMDLRGTAGLSGYDQLVNPTDPRWERYRLYPGDLIYLGTNARTEGSIHHVVMYIGNGKVIHAPHTGDVVRIANLSQASTVVGIARPSVATIQEVTV